MMKYPPAVFTVYFFLVNPQSFSYPDLVGMHDPVFRMAFETFQLLLQFPGQPLIVTVQEGDESAPGVIDSKIPGAAYPLVGLKEIPDSRISQ